MLHFFKDISRKGLYHGHIAKMRDSAADASEKVTNVEAAKLFGVSLGTIVTWRNKAGLTKSYKPYRKHDNDLYRKLYDGGNSINEIAKMFNSNPGTIVKGIRRVGGKIRSKAEAATLRFTKKFFAA